MCLRNGIGARMGQRLCQAPGRVWNPCLRLTWSALPPALFCARSLRAAVGYPSGSTPMTRSSHLIAQNECWSKRRRATHAGVQWELQWPVRVRAGAERGDWVNVSGKISVAVGAPGDTQNAVAAGITRHAL